MCFSFKVVLSNSDFLYFDHPSEPHGEECGNSWAASFTDSRKVFGFVPEDLYNDAGQKTFNCTGRKSCAGELQNVLGKIVLSLVEQGQCSGVVTCLPQCGLG